MSFEDLPLANYPNQYDDEEVPPASAYLPYPGDVEPLVDYIVKMRNSIIAIERELGVNPSGNQTTVAQRLDLMESQFGDFYGVGQYVHRIQIADKYSVNTIYGSDMVVGQVNTNIYQESGLSDGTGTTSVEVSFKAQAYVERDSILTLKLYNVTGGFPSLITQVTFNGTAPYYGGYFTRDVPLTIVTQIPIGEATIELRVAQTDIGIIPDPQKKSIIWDASLLVRSTNRTTDGYAMTVRYVEPTSDDLIVWKFDEPSTTIITYFTNYGTTGLDGYLSLPGGIGVTHEPGYSGMFDNAVLLSGDDMVTSACASPAAITISMWINPTAPIIPNTTIALSKEDITNNTVWSMKFDLNSAISFEFLGTDGFTYSFSCPPFQFNSTASWIFVGFVHDGTNVYTCVNGNYELVGAGIPGIKYAGPLSAGEGSWKMETSSLLVDDVRIAQIARDEGWFKLVYKLATYQYP